MRARLSSISGVLVLTLLSSLPACSSVDPTGFSAAGKIASVKVTPAGAILVPGEQLQAQGVALDISNNSLGDLAVTWASSDPAVAQVSSDGSIAAVRPGTATVAATSEGFSAASRITVSEGGFLGPDGGTVSAFDGAVSLVVPSGALDAPRPIYVDPVMPADPDATSATGPIRIRVGVDFAQPATLTISYNPALGPAGVPEADLGVRILPLRGAPVSAQGTTDLATHSATAQVGGTSVYDVGRIAPLAPCSGPEYRQFDFWLGRWRVANTGADPDARRASSLITAEPGGCAIFEDFRDPPTHGVSINVFDPVTASWYETFVDNNGTRLVLRGGLVGPDMLLTAPALDSRITWSGSSGTVRQVGERSLDGGVNWLPQFDLIYVP